MGEAETPSPSSPSRMPIQSAARLIASLDLSQALAEIHHLAGLSGDHYRVLYERPLHEFIERAQLAPASETHHHARPGGLVIHTVELIQYALKLRKGAKLPVGATPEAMLREREPPLDLCGVCQRPVARHGEVNQQLSTWVYPFYSDFHSKPSPRYNVLSEIGILRGELKRRGSTSRLNW